MDTCLLLLSAVVVLFGTFVYYLIRRHLNYWNTRGIPYETPHLLHGNLQEFRKTKHIIDIFEQFYMKFKGKGPFCGFFMFHAPAVLVTDIELAKRILITDFSNFSNRNIYFNEADDSLSATLMVLQDDHWRNLREKFTPIFAADKMKFTFPTALKAGNGLLDAVEFKLTETSVLDMEDFFNRYTMDVIGLCAFGIDCNSLSNRNSEFRTVGLKVLSELHQTGVLFRFQMSFQNLARRLGMRCNSKGVEYFFTRTAAEAVLFRLKHNAERNDFINLLIKLMLVNGVTPEQVVMQCFSFFKAGFENSAATMTWALYQVARNSKIQERLREEVNAVYERNNGELTYDGTVEMPYLEQIISETFRLYSITPIIARRSERDYPVPGHPKYVIEKGMTVFVSHTGIHMDPDIYPNPKQFDPERFSPEMLKTRDPITHLPFAAGPRQCIGLRFAQMQMRMALALLIRNYKFSIVAETAEPKQYNVQRLVVAPKDGMHLKCEKI